MFTFNTKTHIYKNTLELQLSYPIQTLFYLIHLAFPYSPFSFTLIQLFPHFAIDRFTHQENYFPVLRFVRYLHCQLLASIKILFIVILFSFFSFSYCALQTIYVYDYHTKQGPHRVFTSCTKLP